MQKSTWTGGHTSTVISVDVNKEGIVASGGEGELTVWSKDGSSHNKLLCPLPSLTQPNDSKDINGICFCVINPERLYASCGNKVFGYDLRNPSSAVCEFEFNRDEINQVAIHDKGGFLAACDDSGDIKVIDVQAGRLFKTLHSRNDSICSTVQFRPNRPWEIASGTMDYRIVSWDFSSGRALQELNVQELDEDSFEGAYFLNPPFVHSIHMAGDGRMFAAGLGNGNIQLFRFEGKKKFVPNECLKKHSSSITQVHFARFRPNNLLVSGGDDSRIVAWNLCSSAGSGASGPEPNLAANGSAVSVAHEINHGSKINWITSGSQRESIFVADLTCDISLYHIL